MTLINNRFLLSDAPQGSIEWFAARAGRATGSRAACVQAQIKSGEAATRRNYRIQVVTERLVGKSLDEGGFKYIDMINGQKREPYGRMRHEVETGALVQEAGFAYLPDVSAGCSVDGFMDDFRGFLEIKAPKAGTHIAYLLEARLPPEYKWQITHNFFVTGCDYADFVSFYPELPSHLQYFNVRVMRNEMRAELAAYEAELQRFLAEVDALEKALRTLEDQLRASLKVA